MYGRPRELKFAKFLRWLLKMVYKHEIVIVPREQWDAMIQKQEGRE